MVGEGRPSTFFFCFQLRTTPKKQKLVDGRPSPTMTESGAFIYSDLALPQSEIGIGIEHIDLNGIETGLLGAQ